MKKPTHPKYFPKELEAKWSKKWEEIGLYDSQKSDKAGDPYYVLVELPYPSGDLHIGHWFTFVTPDVLARFKHMMGQKVFFPMGYDAFGLPAENAAIKRNIHPKDWTMSNIEAMTKQFKSMGTMIDWGETDPITKVGRSTTITCLPEYYKWNQWLFLRMVEKGIAYRSKTLSNWCPKDQTVLANEHVEDGKCWRCGEEVVQKEVEQWFLKITSYADALLWENTDKKMANGVDWPQAVREGQNNWIGKSSGAIVRFSVIASEAKQSRKEIATPIQARDDRFIEVFTTRPDTIFGATFLVVSPEHDLLKEVTDEKVKAYIAAAGKKTELERKENKEKTGIFSGLYAINPLTNEEIPVWVADYVLAGYGTGAIMAVPAHDERDFAFAQTFSLPIKRVIARDDMTPRSYLMGAETISDEELEDIGVRIIEKMNSGARKLEIPLKSMQAYQDVIKAKLAPGYWNEIVGGYDVHFIFKNQDGSIDELLIEDETLEEIAQKCSTFNSDPIEKTRNLWGYLAENEWYKPLIVHTQPGEIINSPEWALWKTPEDMEKVIDFLEEKGFGARKTQYHLHDWSVSRQRYWGTPVPIINCDACGAVPVPEKDLPVEIPYDVDYTPKGKPPLASNEAWFHTTCPKCGGKATRDAETLDTFFDSSWYYYRYLSPHYSEGPFDPQRVKEMMPLDIYFGGAEHTLGHTLYARFFTKFFKDIGLIDFDEFALKRIQHGIVLGTDGDKMSKSKGNVINPDDVVKEFGTDAVRLYLSFMMPYEATGPWSTTAMSGMFRFLRRIWDLQAKVGEEDLTKKDLFMMHKTIKKVSEDIAAIKLNTAVAAIMEWLNYVSAKETIGREEYKTMLLLLAPFAPYITEELWSTVEGIGFRDQGNDGVSIHSQAFPKFEEQYLIEDSMTIVVQVNGKMRENVVVDSATAGVQKEVEELAKASEKVKRFLETGEIRNVIFIPGKLINFVVA